MQPNPWRRFGQLPSIPSARRGLVWQGGETGLGGLAGWGDSASSGLDRDLPLLHPWWPGRSWEGEKAQRLWLGTGSVSWGLSPSPAGMGNGKWLCLMSILLIGETALNGAFLGLFLWFGLFLCKEALSLAVGS